MKEQWVGCLSVMVTAGLLLLPVAHAEEVLCEDKSSEIRQQLEYAQQHGNQHRIRGLQRALNAIEENCTNESVLAEAADEVRESQEEVSERQADLEAALRDGDEDDIQKRRTKLSEATRELEAHTQELDTLQRRLND
ncbi:DUF1090 domain-containing protein [Vreelandella olivaria]|uniref:DUF1090 domain-containing protein n=1 Tax=Vreelandella olivaria TaxID=390919 RepID=UPI00201F8D33|nr:DUF1090 domain-containing protein [Halomonas olivaria]